MRRAAAAGLAVVALAAGAALATDGGQTAALERAREVTARLAGTLMPRLQTELAEGGAASALTVCAEVAQEITAEAETDGVRVRRVSTRVRNPADRPDDWERARLDELARAAAEGSLPPELHAVLDLPGGGRELRYLKPIVVQPLCLRCHGPAEALEPEVRARLAELYPDDEATGYAAGDLRGAVSVRVDLPTDAP